MKTAMDYVSNLKIAMVLEMKSENYSKSCSVKCRTQILRMQILLVFAFSPDKLGENRRRCWPKNRGKLKFGIHLYFCVLNNILPFRPNPPCDYLYIVDLSPSNAVFCL